MPRRRLLVPSFTDDIEVAQLTRDERLFLVGCLRNADDEGRLSGHRVYLKSEIFMYDEDIDLEHMQEIKESTLEKMKSWHCDNVWLLLPYQNSRLEYLYFPNWFAFNKPSHPTPSKIPVPPPKASSSGGTPEALSNTSRGTPEAPPNTSRETPVALSNTSRGTPEVPPSASDLSQVKSGQGRVGKVREAQVDFKRYFNSESDLTDFLMTKLTESISAARQAGAHGEQWAIAVLEEFWNQVVGKMPTGIFMGGLDALKKYPIEVVARAFVKAARYQGGKHQKWKYIQTIIDEEVGKRKGR